MDRAMMGGLRDVERVTTRFLVVLSALIMYSLCGSLLTVDGGDLDQPCGGKGSCVRFPALSQCHWMIKLFSESLPVYFSSAPDSLL